MKYSVENPIDLMPVPVVMCEVYREELNYGGVYDQELGRELTLVEVVYAENPDVQAVFIDNNRHLSQASRDHNTRVERSASRGYVDHNEKRVAIVAMFPTPEQLALREVITAGITLDGQGTSERPHMPTHHAESHGTTHDRKLIDPVHTPVK